MRIRELQTVEEEAKNHLHSILQQAHGEISFGQVPAYPALGTTLACQLLSVSSDNTYGKLCFLQLFQNKHEMMR